MKALVVGGTGPTGPHVVNGLLERGHDVAIFHRGTHEIDEVAQVEHIHGDPHFREAFEEALGGREFELVISTYGRIRLHAQALAGRCDRFLGVGGVTVYLGNAEPFRSTPYGMKVLAREEDRLADRVGEPDTEASRFVQRMVDTEREVLALHELGAFGATWFRYPIIYGPRNIIPWEWSVIKRVADGRRQIILADGGHNIRSRSSGRNAAHAVLLAVDQPEAAAGQVFNVAEDEQLTLRQWVERLNDVIGGDLEVVSLPWLLAKPGHVFLPFRGTGSPHVLVDTSKIRRDLGYADVISVADALRESVAWYTDNPVTPERYPNFPDRFDYEREDLLLGAYDLGIAVIQDQVPWPDSDIIHDYAHPREPGQLRDHRGR